MRDRGKAHLQHSTSTVREFGINVFTLPYQCPVSLEALPRTEGGLIEVEVPKVGEAAQPDAA